MNQYFKIKFYCLASHPEINGYCYKCFLIYWGKWSSGCCCPDINVCQFFFPVLLPYCYPLTFSLLLDEIGENIVGHFMYCYISSHCHIYIYIYTHIHTFLHLMFFLLVSIFSCGIQGFLFFRIVSQTVAWR